MDAELVNERLHNLETDLKKLSKRISKINREIKKLNKANKEPISKKPSKNK